MTFFLVFDLFGTCSASFFVWTFQISVQVTWILQKCKNVTCLFTIKQKLCFKDEMHNIFAGMFYFDYFDATHNTHWILCKWFHWRQIFLRAWNPILVVFVSVKFVSVALHNNGHYEKFIEPCYSFNKRIENRLLVPLVLLLFLQ